MMQKKFVLANGTTPRKLNIPGEAELTGKGMGMNAQRDGRKYTDKNIYVVGGADGAVKEALYLSKFAKQVTIIHFEDTLGCIEEFKKQSRTNSKHKTAFRIKTSRRIWSRTGRSVGNFR